MKIKKEKVKTIFKKFLVLTIEKGLFTLFFLFFLSLLFGTLIFWKYEKEIGIQVQTKITKFDLKKYQKILEEKEKIKEKWKEIEEKQYLNPFFRD
mgnify:CR=1 FL=1